MTHDDIVQLVGTYGQLYMLGLFIALLLVALWPRKGRSFDQLARIPLADEPPSEHRRNEGDRP